MLEIRIHGRGGQGVKKAAQILGRAAFLSGYYTQDFSIYGAERRGAPVVSFLRIDKKPVLERGYIETPNIVIILDDTLNLKRAIDGLEKEGIVLINSVKGKKLVLSGRNVLGVDATSIALKTLGVPIPNTTMTGAVVRLLKRKIPLKNLQKAIGTELLKYSKKIVNANKEVAKIGYGVIDV